MIKDKSGPAFPKGVQCGGSMFMKRIGEYFELHKQDGTTELIDPERITTPTKKG